MEPKMEQKIAMVRSWGVAFTGGSIPPLVCAEESDDGDACSLGENRNAGRATQSTPAKAMKPAAASLTVKGSYH